MKLALSLCICFTLTHCIHSHADDRWSACVRQLGGQNVGQSNVPLNILHVDGLQSQCTSLLWLNLWLRNGLTRKSTVDVGLQLLILSIGCSFSASTGPRVPSQSLPHADVSISDLSQ